MENYHICVFNLSCVLVSIDDFIMQLVEFVDFSDC